MEVSMILDGPGLVSELDDELKAKGLRVTGQSVHNGRPVITVGSVKKVPADSCRGCCFYDAAKYLWSCPECNTTEDAQFVLEVENGA